MLLGIQTSRGQCIHERPLHKVSKTDEAVHHTSSWMPSFVKHIMRAPVCEEVREKQASTQTNQGKKIRRVVCSAIVDNALRKKKI